MTDLDAARHIFDRGPAPQWGKPKHLWQGVMQRVGNTPDIKAHPFMFRCPAPMCFYQVSAGKEKDIMRQAEEHYNGSSCPWYGGGTTTLSWGIMSDQFLRHIWAQLDLRMEIILGRNYDPSWDDNRCREENQRARYEARGLATSLAILMPPFFNHPDEIAREAKLRYDKRVAGEDYETPGIGRLKFKPPHTTLDASGQRTGVHREPVPAKGSAGRSKLNDKEIEAIRFAMDSGMFKAKDLAKTYGVSEAVIEEVCRG